MTPDELRKMVADDDKVDFSGLAGLTSEMSVELAKVKGGAAVGKALAETLMEIAIRFDRVLNRRNTIALTLANAMDLLTKRDAELARVLERFDEVTDPDFVWEVLSDTIDIDVSYTDLAKAVSAKQRAAITPEPDGGAA
jgi:hypothetical protein